MDESIITAIRKRYKSIQGFFDERSRRVNFRNDADNIGTIFLHLPVMFPKQHQYSVVHIHEQSHDAIR
jgi:hypothetical protein